VRRPPGRKNRKVAAPGSGRNDGCGFPGPEGGAWETRQLWVAVVTRAGAVFSLAISIAIVDLVLTGANTLGNWRLTWIPTSLAITRSVQNALRCVRFRAFLNTLFHAGSALPQADSVSLATAGDGAGLLRHKENNNCNHQDKRKLQSNFHVPPQRAKRPRLMKRFLADCRHITNDCTCRWPWSSSFPTQAC